LRTRVRQLSKAYGFLWALRDISFELQPGECVALLGPNGAGKTTLLKLLAALLSPTQGEITLNGARLNAGSSRLRSFIGYLSPHEHIYDGLTLRENLILFAALYGRKENPAENEQRLKAVGLEGWSDQYAAALSSGMKCRLSIAKWLLLKPEMMLFDEPYGVLDGNGVEVLETYIRGLCSSGGIAVIATHHTQRVLRLCSRAIVLERGNIVFDEPKREPWDSFHRAYGKFTPRE
jgi:heme ABC exporter ATP-binding subunit CcmA